MLLEKLYLYNFRQFFGEHELSFSTDPEKNVTLIHGENGVGKTTILNAIWWCLFHDFTPDFENPNDLISRPAVQRGENTASVSLTFNYEDCLYRAIRFYQRNGEETFKIFKIENGDSREIPNPQPFINSILPPYLAGYFFFHGEGISSLSEARKGERFRKAIRDILGFTFAEHAIEDLEKIKKYYSKQATEASKENKELEKAQTNLEKYQNRLSEKTQELKNIQNQISNEEEYIDYYDSQLGEKGNEHIKTIKTSLEKAHSDLEKFNKQLIDKKKERATYIQRYGWPVFGRKTAQIDLEFLNEESAHAHIPPPYNESFVKDVLNAGTCICGRPLEEHSQEWKNVESLLSSAGQAEITHKISEARAVAQNILSYSDEFFEVINNIETNIDQLDYIVREKENDVSYFNEQLKGIDEEELREIAIARDKAKRRRDEAISKRGELSKVIEEFNNNIDKFKRDLAKEKGTSEKFEKFNALRNLTEKLSQRTEEKLDEIEQSSRNVIAQRVNNILAKFSRNDYQVQISTNFEFELVRQDYGVVSKSRGENLLLNLAFVSSLIELAQKRESASGDFLVPGTVAPFVIDAPFGELDNTYKAATANFLPETTKQLIILVSSSHWEGTVEENLKDKIGSEYVLISNETSEQGQRPDDIIHLNGKDIRQSYYSSQENYSSVLEV